MTDRYYALTVILKKDTRSDDAEPIIEAIKMIRGVEDVQPLLSDPVSYMAQERAKSQFRDKILQIFYEEK